MGIFDQLVDKGLDKLGSGLDKISNSEKYQKMVGKMDERDRLAREKEEARMMKYAWYREKKAKEQKEAERLRLEQESRKKLGYDESIELIRDEIDKINDSKIISIKKITIDAVYSANKKSIEDSILQSKDGGVPAKYSKMNQKDLEKLSKCSFMRQVNLADLPYNPALPKSGILQFWEVDWVTENFQIVYIPIKDAVKYENYEFNDLGWEAVSLNEYDAKKFDKQIVKEYIIHDHKKLIEILREKMASNPKFDMHYYLAGNTGWLIDAIKNINNNHMFGKYYDVQYGFIHEGDKEICIMSLESGNGYKFGDDGNLGIFIKRKMTNMKPGLQNPKDFIIVTSCY